ncbi:MFS transporter [Sulfitobacter sp. HGT1]|uniref:MFS transporter n=1 Tax=Sulfitobacter sp. HGT1 TaxID=2735435 RepID=UPI0015934B0F|nr:MFS transporter [Sulfitobacter sp. HGT1]
MQDGLASAAFEKLSGAEGEADDLSQGAQKAEAPNALRHVASLSMTKIADGLIDPKLMLSWLLTSLGAPAVFAGVLVPIRESGALLPQMLMASWVQSMPRRKWVWVLGSAGQGIFAALIVLAALTLDGAAAGYAICAALGGLALSRAACSVSYKDILGKTVGQSRRGAITGLAGSVSAVGVVILAVLLMSGLFEDRRIVIAAIALAAGLWGAAALLFSTLKEMKSDPSKGEGADFGILKKDANLRRFILVRGLLASTALAPPYFVVLAGGEDQSALGQLGALVLASALASFLSSYIWGRLSDRSSRKVLMLTGCVGAVAMLGAVALSMLGLAMQIWAMPLVLFILMIAYHGVRQGRSTYLVDMSPENQRSAYAAVSNTVIGVLLLVAGVAGGGVALIGPTATLVLFALMAIGAAAAAIGLREVEAAD